MGKKRAKIVARKAISRADERTAVVVEGKCQIGYGPIQDVLLTDVSPHGCRFIGTAVGVTKAEPLQVWFAEVGPIAGTLRWARKGALGVHFDEAIDEAVIAKVCAIEPAPTVVPLRRRTVEDRAA